MFTLKLVRNSPSDPKAMAEPEETVVSRFCEYVLPIELFQTSLIVAHIEQR